MKETERLYVRPALKVVELQVRNQLLTGSDTGSGIEISQNDYADGGEEEWDD